MSLTNIRTNLKNLLESVSTVDNVNDYRRRLTDWADIESAFQSGAVLHAWIIKYSGSTFEKDTAIDGTIANRNFEIWGLYSLNDTNATEKTFDDIVEDVELAFTNIYVLNSNGKQKINNITTVMDEYLFGGVLCNRCTMTLQIKELIPNE